MAEGKITWINGPVLRAGTSDTFRINEAVLVGGHQLLGALRVEVGQGLVTVCQQIARTVLGTDRVAIIWADTSNSISLSSISPCTTL